MKAIQHKPVQKIKPYEGFNNYHKPKYRAQDGRIPRALLAIQHPLLDSSHCSGVLFTPDIHCVSGLSCCLHTTGDTESMISSRSKEYTFADDFHWTCDEEVEAAIAQVHMHFYAEHKQSYYLSAEAQQSSHFIPCQSEQELCMYMASVECPRSSQCLC